MKIKRVIGNIVSRITSIPRGSIQPLFLFSSWQLLPWLQHISCPWHSTLLDTEGWVPLLSSCMQHPKFEDLKFCIEIEEFFRWSYFCVTSKPSKMQVFSPTHLGIFPKTSNLPPLGRFVKGSLSLLWERSKIVMTGVFRNHVGKGPIIATLGAF